MMGADDYVDAHTRLVKLRLTKGQQPEMVRVLLECCGQEGIFNRYYALLGARLCETFREFRFALQFAFWDAFKTLGELTLHRTANTAKLLAQLIQRDAVPLACLKVVGWSRPSERAVFFWQVFFIELLGAPPAAMIQSGTKGLKHFKRNEGDTGYTLRDPPRPPRERSLNSVLGVETGGPDGRRASEPGHSVTDYLKLKDLIMRMLTYQPAKRITPFQAISHSFFGSTESTEAQTEPAGAAPAASGSGGDGGSSGAAPMSS